jgi:signal transduction histidine kinase
LGLSICYTIMQQLGGSIALHSEQGKGTEFTLFIPNTPPNELREHMEERLEMLT